MLFAAENVHTIVPDPRRDILHDITLPDLALLDIQGDHGHYHGGDQAWYPTHWQRQAGCGPTNCANLLWYLAQRTADNAMLCPYPADRKTGFLQLMEAVWDCMTPGSMGINSTQRFIDGVCCYADTKGISLQTESLDIPPIHAAVQDYDRISAFILRAIQRNLPVAFLNLSNGTLHNLDSWHWVTIVALHGDNAIIYDQGCSRSIQLQQWLMSTALGGGFVTICK